MIVHLIWLANQFVDSTLKIGTKRHLTQNDINDDIILQTL